MWIFDRNDLKDAITLLLLNDSTEKDCEDLDMKKLIRLQFENDLDMKTWAMNLFDKVCWLPLLDIIFTFTL